MPAIDMEYLALLTERIRDLLGRLHETIWEPARVPDLAGLCDTAIDAPCRTITESGLITRLNNQGRRPEQVLFSWLRGHAAQEYFAPAIAGWLGANAQSVRRIGGDDFTSVDTFKRTPGADLELDLESGPCRIEVQSGFQGVNDIKQHKVLEARRLREAEGVQTLCTHFDLYNGQAAIVQLDAISDDDLNWVTRQQMEGQTVFSIDQNSFLWRLIDPPPAAETLDLEVFRS